MRLPCGEEAKTAVCRRMAYTARQKILNLAERWWWFSCSVVSDSCDPMDCSLPDSSVHGIRQEYWNGLPFPSPGDLPNLRIKPRSLALQTGSLPIEGTVNPVPASH